MKLQSGVRSLFVALFAGGGAYLGLALIGGYGGLAAGAVIGFFAGIGASLLGGEPEPPRAEDFSATLHQAIEEARASGVDVPELEASANTAYTTSSEYLGEVGEAIARFLKNNRSALPSTTVNKFRHCLAQAGRA
jgi:predicted lipid-binding transport protein (Tim44 family)